MFSSSAPETVTVSVWAVGPFPFTEYVNVQVLVSPGWMTNGIVWAALAADTHERPEGVEPEPAPIASTSEEIVTGSDVTDVFLILTVKVTDPPGSETDVGLAVFVTESVGLTFEKFTVALPVFCA